MFLLLKIIPQVHLVNSDAVDVIVGGADLVLVLGGSGGDVEVLFDVVHVVEGGHSGQTGWAGAGPGTGLLLQTRLSRIESL